MFHDGERNFAAGQRLVLKAILNGLLGLVLWMKNEWGLWSALSLKFDYWEQYNSLVKETLPYVSIQRLYEYVCKQGTLIVLKG